MNEPLWSSALAGPENGTRDKASSLKARRWRKLSRNVLEDAEERAAARAREAVRRREQDRKLVARMANQIGVLFPGCPAHELAAIAEHTAARGSGRIGRTEAGRNLEDQRFDCGGYRSGSA